MVDIHNKPSPSVQKKVIAFTHSTILFSTILSYKQLYNNSLRPTEENHIT